MMQQIISFNQTGFLNDFYRDTAHDVRRYIYFDKKEFKNNRIPTTMEVQTNSPKNRISKSVLLNS